MIDPFLLADYQSRWNQFASSLAPYANSIIAFYTIDEPNLYGSCLYLPDVQTMNNTVRATFGKPVAVIYNYDGDQYMWVGSNYYDWIGFDCYEGSTEPRCASSNYTEMYRDLKSHLQSGQRTILVPQAGAGSQNNPQAMTYVRTMYQIALADSTAIAVLPFIWESISDFTGLSQFAQNYQQPFINIGTQVKGGPTYPAGVAPISRYYNTINGTLFFSESFDEGLNAGFAFQGINWNVYSSSVPGMHPLYRCQYNGRPTYFISQESNCEGQIYQRVIGYASNSQSSGTTPLYRFVNTTTVDFLLTTDYQEGVNASGYGYQGSIGYVPVVTIAQ